MSRSAPRRQQQSLIFFLTLCLLVYPCCISAQDVDSYEESSSEAVMPCAGRYSVRYLQSPENNNRNSSFESIPSNLTSDSSLSNIFPVDDDANVTPSDNNISEAQPVDDEASSGNEVQVEELYVDVSFADTLKVILFLSTAWVASNVSRAIGLPSLVGEICSGFILGPPLLDFCPFPQAMVLVGNFGLVGLILESGIQLDIRQLKETGMRCVALAGTGTLLGLGSGVAVAFPKGISTAVAVGAAFAPSSLGVAGTVLTRKKVIHNPNGQLVVASSVVDDILSLILLSLMQVFVQDNPSTFDFILPFLSSFGYLFVLGYVGIRWMPYLIEERLLPKFPEEQHENCKFCVMFGLALIYLPLLHYSGASYLTGAFLAGLSVSQLQGIQKAYQHKMQEIKVWLMRIFFAATIGFQVPIKRFNRLEVLKWGIFFLVPVLAKIPLGMYVPRYRKDRSRPEDFPYDPYHRSVAVTVLSMLCRGEFNFLVASFGLSEGLLSPDMYSAVVFAILISSVVVPVVLSRVLDYYQKLYNDYMSGDHPVKRIGNTSDGTRPLYLTVEARTPNRWGLQDNFQKALENAGLSIVDHRSYHQPGDDIKTKIFVQDQSNRVRVEGCFSSRRLSLSSSGGVNGVNGEEEQADVELADNFGREQVENRLDEIRAALASCLSPDDDPRQYSIFVHECEPNATKDTETPQRGALARHKKTYSFNDNPPATIFEELEDDVEQFNSPIGGDREVVNNAIHEGSEKSSESSSSPSETSSIDSTP